MSIEWDGETLTFSTPLSEIEQGVYNTFKESFAKQERERIIKLLEEQAEGDLLFAQDLNNPSKDVAYTMFKGNVIALIKEENK